MGKVQSLIGLEGMDGKGTESLIGSAGETAGHGWERYRAFDWFGGRGGFRGVARPISPPSERFRGWRRHPLTI